MSIKKSAPDDKVSFRKSLLHLIVFQFKLLADALRDFLLSPISVVAFILDVIIRPKASKSFTYKLMKAGQRTDRTINLFNEYDKAGNYTLDDSASSIEALVQEKIKEHRDKRNQES